MKFNPDNMLFPGIYRGKVLDNTDPDKLGKLKVEVLGVFTGIAKEYLPWAVPGLPVFCGAGSGYGWFGVPAVGSWVWCFFEDGDHQQPVYFAEAPDGVHGFPTEGESGYPDSRGWVTPAGHSFVFDDNGAITLTHKDGSIIDIAELLLTLTHKDGCVIEMSPLAITLSHPTGVGIVISAAGVAITYPGGGSAVFGVGSAVMGFGNTTITMDGTTVEIGTI